VSASATTIVTLSHARLLAAHLPLATRFLQLAIACGEDLFLPACEQIRGRHEAYRAV